MFSGQLKLVEREVSNRLPSEGYAVRVIEAGREPILSERNG